MFCRCLSPNGLTARASSPAYPGARGDLISLRSRSAGDHRFGTLGRISNQCRDVHAVTTIGQANHPRIVERQADEFLIDELLPARKAVVALHREEIPFELAGVLPKVSEQEGLMLHTPGPANSWFMESPIAGAVMDRAVPSPRVIRTSKA